MDIEHIEKNGQVFAQIPLEQLEALLANHEMLQNLVDYNKAVEEAEEFLSADFTFALHQAYHAGQSVIPLWRNYRGMTQNELAHKANIPQSYLSAIETGQKPGSIQAIKKIATALNVTIDDLILE